MFAFNAGIADEPIQGSPKFIRTLTSDLLQESEFDPRGKLIERRAFRPDGSLSYRETHHTLGSITFDGNGAQVSSTERTLTDTGWREVTVGADGKCHTKIARVDADRRVVELQAIGPEGQMEISYQAIFDSQGTHIGGDVQSNGIRAETRQEGARTTIVSYGSDGTMLSRAELSRTGDLSTCLITLPFQRLKTERIDPRDEAGNWTSKTVFESNDPNEIGEPISVIERTISYFKSPPLR